MPYRIVIPEMILFSIMVHLIAYYLGDVGRFAPLFKTRLVNQTSWALGVCWYTLPCFWRVVPRCCCRGHGVYSTVRKRAPRSPCPPRPQQISGASLSPGQKCRASQGASDGPVRVDSNVSAPTPDRPHA